ncbi:MAG: hypothetical protein K9L68_05175 [Spirochaetales bacterium]|nr:hypothetical protein [Spirochaetales bacterium]MCF7937971.1 hypothetical protein [Spirochaetales bacterium]
MARNLSGSRCRFHRTEHRGPWPSHDGHLERNLPRHTHGYYHRNPSGNPDLFRGFFAPKAQEKPWLLLGILLRTAGLFSLGMLLLSFQGSSAMLILSLLLIMGVFSFSGAFAGLSYTHLLGKEIEPARRSFILSGKEFAGGAATLGFGLLARYILSEAAYPKNYAWLFLIASGLLATAVFGFLLVRETPDAPGEAGGSGGEDPGRTKSRPIRDMMRNMDRNLLRYILVLNLTGFSLGIAPFYIALAKRSFGLSGEQVGDYLMLQIAGVIVASVLWYRLSRGRSFRHVVRICMIGAAVLPLFALFASGKSVTLYIFVFLWAGFLLSARRIALEGLLIEISSNENRVIYSALAGAFSFVSAVFPLVSGFLIRGVGYPPIFFLTSAAVLTALIPLAGIRAKE